MANKKNKKSAIKKKTKQSDPRSKDCAPSFFKTAIQQKKDQLSTFSANIKNDPYLLTVIVFSLIFIGTYLYLCLGYNLQFYTEDEHYVPYDMMDLSILSQWKFSNYRVSSSFGSFIYYPLYAFLKQLNHFLGYFSQKSSVLTLIPLMVSKLAHTIFVIMGWFWFGIELGLYIKRKWNMAKSYVLLGFIWTAMLPINIFLAKTNNYDSIYNIFCLLAIIYFLQFIDTRKLKFLGLTFILSSMAIQEKFAAFTIFSFLIFLGGFFVGRHKVKTKIISFKSFCLETTTLLSAICIGTILPTMMRFLAELFFFKGGHPIEHLAQYKPFFAYSVPFLTIQNFSFTLFNSRKFPYIFKYPFLSILGAILCWFGLMFLVRMGFSKMKKKDNETDSKGKFILILSVFQILFLLWGLSSFWYEIPPSGVYPLDKPPPGTYIPARLVDSQATFYYGVGYLEYIFIRLLGFTQFFLKPLYLPVVILLLAGPFINVCSLVKKWEKDRSLLLISSLIFNVTMAYVFAILALGIPFGGRYANIYLTLLGLAAFFNFIFLTGLFSSSSKKSQFLILAVMITMIVYSIAELLPYGPSYQAFGNLLFPQNTTGGWGEATSAMVQAAKNDQKLERVIPQTYTTYTGLAIKNPFFSPLINLRLVQSVKNDGGIRKINYLLIESIALGQNRDLQKILQKAKKYPQSIVWTWNYPREPSAWLVDLNILGFSSFEKTLKPEVVERHFDGEWTF